MIVNHKTLLRDRPIVNMLTCKRADHGVTYGLGEAGYDIRIKQDVHFRHNDHLAFVMDVRVDKEVTRATRFALASSVEEFIMPNHLVGIVHDKSTWARRGLSVFNTVIEPGWRGFLTLELVYHSKDELIIPAGAGIAQVVFHQVTDRVEYQGRYQNQANQPVATIEHT